MNEYIRVGEVAKRQFEKLEKTEEKLIKLREDYNALIRESNSTTSAYKEVQIKLNKTTKNFNETYEELVKVRTELFITTANVYSKTEKCVKCGGKLKIPQLTENNGYSKGYSPAGKVEYLATECEDCRASHYFLPQDFEEK